MLKILLADNQAIFRAGIAKVLAVEDDLRVVAQAQSVDQMMMAIEKFRAAVLILSASFVPDMASLVQAANRAKTGIVVVAENGENAQKYLVVGVRGVVYRNVSGDMLVECVRRVARGEKFTQETKPATATAESDDFVGARVRDRLTPKELRIVALIVQGYKNKEIAVQLGTTEQVIKNYLRNVYDKIGVSDRLELALFTIHHHILAEAAAATTEGRMLQ
ncbi:MAG TPA: response regulator transcription factor [Candidatus Koribacter sp.]|jgi:DNA-binding NarL/FixJ family response regulator